jgi:hypothetical protein
MGAYATGTPLLPTGYVAGTITISSGQSAAPQQLLSLIQTQLDPNCPGAAYELTLYNGGAEVLYIGRQNLAGPLSSSNYGYQLQTGQSRTYRSSVTGAHSSVGDLEVFVASASTFNVEVAGA